MKVIFLISYIFAGAWTYENGNTQKWAKECKVGKHQSPINFEDKKMKVVEATKPVWGSSQKGEFINNGHTIQVNTPDSDFKLVTPDGKEFILVQYHIHIPSEHHRYSRSFDSEIHFVHKGPNDQLAVYGIWFRIAKKSNPFMESLLSQGVPEKGEKIQVDVDFSWLNRHLKRAKKHWTYAGSLTTPPCSEHVLWTLPDVAYPISVEHYTAMHLKMPFNARPTQPNAKKEDEPVAEGGQEYDENGYYVNQDFQGYDFHDYIE